MPLPEKIAKLVEQFKQNEAAYRSGQYNETLVRKDFIDPMFTCLGWDMNNEAGYAHNYRDVIHEDAIDIDGSKRAPDYCFRVGGVRKFFLEAKKPSVNIRDDVGPAYQLRRYAWSAKLPLSILTDFEEFAIYDCRTKPNPADKAAAHRVRYFHYTEYEKHWDFIAERFSKEAILKGAFDKYAESTQGKRGTATVDTAFLAEIEAWRDALARNIALRNPGIDQRGLNDTVQRTIDRIIFLRLCEDRGIEDYGRLKALSKAKDIYTELKDLFQQADDRYNSGLFHFHPEKGRADYDGVSLGLSIDDKILKPILGGLYYPESPYEFSVLPADILGQVYEQFLGKVIRLTAGHQAKVEEKPEVRKAGGVYYTPTYIVDYIVQNTVGKLLEGKKPADIDGAKPGTAPLRVLDPACGSGSFLIVVYQFLLDWYLKSYFADKPEKLCKGKNPKLRQRAENDYALTIPERKRILLDHVYGVDIDPQAVEVTKLSLLLKVLEGETADTLGLKSGLFHQRALPDLDNNIKCGNSLIGPDFYKGQQADVFDTEEMFRINAFDWKQEFPFIVKDGGFDAVVGNPPYVRVRTFKELYPGQATYLESHYKCATHVWDLYMLFFELGLSLSRKDGLFSFIVPIQTLHQPNCESIRTLLLEQTSVITLADLSKLKVFQTAIVKNCILVCKKQSAPSNEISVVVPQSPAELFDAVPHSWPQARALQNPGLSLKTDLLSENQTLCTKLQNSSWQLSELCYVTFGLRSCAKGRGEGGKERLITDNGLADNAKPYMEGRDIVRYAMNPKGHFIKYLPAEMYSPRSPLLFETKKIVSQSMLSRKRLVATLDVGHHYVEQSLVCIVPHGIVTDIAPPIDLPLTFLLGVMNSRLERFYFGTFLIDHSLGGGLIHATPGTQGKLLIPRALKTDIDRMVSLVERMLTLHKQLPSAKTEHERKMLQRQITATDEEIDQLVYALYGLTAEEISIVEGAE